jgi:hypothetical protein
LDFHKEQAAKTASDTAAHSNRGFVTHQKERADRRRALKYITKI